MRRNDCERQRHEGVAKRNSSNVDVVSYLRRQVERAQVVFEQLQVERISARPASIRRGSCVLQPANKQKNNSRDFFGRIKCQKCITAAANVNRNSPSRPVRMQAEVRFLRCAVRMWRALTNPFLCART